MAGLDYVLCTSCGGKILYDGDMRIREQLEEKYGEGKIEMLCPLCVRKLKKKLLGKPEKGKAQQWPQG